MRQSRIAQLKKVSVQSVENIISHFYGVAASAAMKNRMPEISLLRRFTFRSQRLAHIYVRLREGSVPHGKFSLAHTGRYQTALRLAGGREQIITVRKL